MNNLSACGLLCDTCEFFKNQCLGCHQQKGKPFWTTEYKVKVCPLYDCSVNQKNLKDCGSCDELPCKTFKEMKDPNSTLEEHEKGIIERVNRLKSNH